MAAASFSVLASFGQPLKWTSVRTPFASGDVSRQRFSRRASLSHACVSLLWLGRPAMSTIFRVSLAAGGASTIRASAGWA